VIFLSNFLPVGFGTTEFLRHLRPVRAGRMWPTAAAVGKPQFLTLLAASADDRIPYSG